MEKSPQKQQKGSSDSEYYSIETKRPYLKHEENKIQKAHAEDILFKRRGVDSSLEEKIDQVENKHRDRLHLLPKDFELLEPAIQKRELAKIPEQYDLTPEEALRQDEKRRAVYARLDENEAQDMETKGRADIIQEEVVDPEQHAIEQKTIKAMKQRIGVESLQMVHARERQRQGKRINAQHPEENKYIEPTENRKMFDAALEKAAESKMAYRKKTEEYQQRGPLQKIWHAPGMITTTLFKEGYQAGNDYLDMRNAGLVNSIDENSSFKAWEKQALIGGVKFGGALRGGIPVLGFASLFAFTWLVDWGLNKITAWRKKNLWNYEKTFGWDKKKGGGDKKKK